MRSAGIVGAQYIMGALLVNRGAPADVAAGTEWLEKAVAGGSPPAMFHLASLLLQQKDESALARGRELFRSSACAGYPEAVGAVRNAGASVDQLSCPPAPERDFSCEWSVTLRWDKTGPAKPATATASYRIVIGGHDVHVSTLIDGKWQEVKPGKLTLSQNDQTLTVAVRTAGGTLTASGSSRGRSSSCEQVPTKRPSRTSAP